jgi:hypothetical protein
VPPNPARIILRDFIARKIFGEEYRSGLNDADLNGSRYVIVCDCTLCELKVCHLVGCEVVESIGNLRPGSGTFLQPP